MGIGNWLRRRVFKVGSEEKTETDYARYTRVVMARHEGWGTDTTGALVSAVLSAGLRGRWLGRPQQAPRGRA